MKGAPAMKKIITTPLDEVSENKYLDDLRNSLNNMSKWLPAITPTDGETRKLRIPKTVIVQASDDICQSFFMERQGDRDRIIQFVSEQVMPKVKDAGIYPRIFMKNGGFSNKYQFSDCTPGADEVQIALNLIDMNYAALCVGAEGITEVCLRELIPHNEKEIPSIYHGMPLRPEFRVFYDFDWHQPLYVVNYWDWAYCHNAICRSLTDKIVYEAYYPTLLDQYNQLKDGVIEMIAADMENVAGLSGIWSVDVLYCEPQEYHKGYEGFWLIDMAVGPRSAYWNPELAKG